LFIAATVIAVNRLHPGVPRTLIATGILAVLFHQAPISGNLSL
jgi:hypothetical protein